MNRKIINFAVSLKNAYCIQRIGALGGVIILEIWRKIGYNQRRNEIIYFVGKETSFFEEPKM